jgi:hypothetical protein
MDIQGFATGPPRAKDPSKMMRMPAWELASGGRGEMERNKKEDGTGRLEKELRDSLRILENVGRGKPPVASVFQSRKIVEDVVFSNAVFHFYLVTYRALIEISL